jgi:hypothetical protein
MGTDSIADWQAFFTFVGLVAGGLTGLIFVALSLQITEVRTGPAYVKRARTTLGALTGILVLSGLVLIPSQTATGLGLESLVLFIALIADVARTYRSFEGPGEKFERPVLARTFIALLLLGLGAIGSVGLLIGLPSAMPLIGLSTLFGLPLRLLQAWALLVAALPIQQHEPGSAGRVDGAPPKARRPAP